MFYKNGALDSDPLHGGDSSRSNSNRSSNGSIIQNHICYLHSNAEVVCISCVKKLVLEKKININILGENIVAYKERLNEILKRSIHFENSAINQEEEEEEYEEEEQKNAGEIQVLRTQAIQISKNNKTNILAELKRQVAEKEASNRIMRAELTDLRGESVRRENFFDSFDAYFDGKEHGNVKSLDFYAQNLTRDKHSRLKEVVSLLDLQRNASNNYYYICNKRLPLPKYLSKALRIGENTKIFNKQLFLLIEHLSKFLEVIFVIHFSSGDFELARATLNMVFAENNRGMDHSDSRIVMIIVKKMSFMIFILAKIHFERVKTQFERAKSHENGVKSSDKYQKQTTLPLNVNEQDFLGVLMSRCLLGGPVDCDLAGPGPTLVSGVSDGETIDTVKQALLDLLF